MPVQFSTITPMSQATISRKPTYTNEAQPAASSPITTEQPTKKKSRWFLKTLVAAAVVLGAAAALRGKVDIFKTFDKASTLAADAKFADKAMYYGKKGVAVVGDFVIEKGKALYEAAIGLFNKAKASVGSSSSTAA